MSAKDKATSKEQSIIIKASSGLSDAEVEHMMKDADENKEQDKKFHELVTARNHADSLVHATEKSLKDLGDKVSADEKSKAEVIIKELRELMKGDDKDAMDAKTKELTDLSSGIAQKAYTSQQGSAADASAAGAQQSQQSESKKDEGVVDAEFEEVKDKDK